LKTPRPRTTSRGLVLAELLSGEEMDRARLAASTGLSFPTVARIVDDLLTQGIVLEQRKIVRQGPGRHAAALNLDPRAALVVGIDLGGTHCRMVLADALGRAVVRSHEATPRELAGEELAGWLVDGVQTLVRDHADDMPLRAVAIGLPGVVAATAALPPRWSPPLPARPPSGGAERPPARRGRRSRINGNPARAEAGAYVIGTRRAASRQKALDFGAQEFVDLENDALEDVGGVDLVFDVLGGDIQKRSAGLVRAGGTLVTVTGPPEARPADGLAIDFVVVSDRAQLSEIAQRVRDGRVRTNIGNVATLDDAVAAFNPTERIKGKTIISVRP